MKRILTVGLLSFLSSLVFMESVSAADLRLRDQKNSKPVESRFTLKDMSPEERQVFLRGKVSPEAHIIGGVVGTFLGFGTGHAVQGLYNERGAITFTIGQGVSFLFLVSGMGSCASYANCRNTDTLVIIGAVGFIGFRIWEIIDVWAGPFAHNSQYRSLKRATEQNGVSFFTIPTPKGELLSGLQIRF